MIATIHNTFKGRKTIAVCSAVLLLCFLITILAPWISPHDPVKVNLELKLQPPSPDNLLGTDHLGRDNLSRLLFGARISLGLVFMVFMASLGMGLLVGTAAGYRGGWIDYAVMRFCDGVMAFPNLVLVLGIVGIFGPGIMQVVLALLFVQWVYYARMFRGLVVSLRERQFITAARISGSSSWKIIRLHIIPNVLPPIIVIGTLEMGWAIMDISALSFLGLGIQAPTPEWGAMIHEGKAFIRSHPELMLYPGLLILLVVINFNLLGEALSSHFGVKKHF
ncbi:nickel ABC transporter permease subunit NikC [Paenibacillus sp. FSL H7-0331]|uniref:nickel ABC transporter permease subunit NikC n=1 Tax=Paenibacillus sp. FSL H7-0331 TaxID=1920421 RepID=UPI00096C7761|nr:nickel ABC transporter permease subunit NikC [Paenibacillus sp. FSL H7-0331]OMF18923.1 nickel ABC transporter permease subunit NikC [Paenibacillus sp. FSL H7-0331]